MEVTFADLGHADVLPGKGVAAARRKRIEEVFRRTTTVGRVNW